MICPSCKSENIPGADLCAECNTDLSGSDVSVSTTAVEEDIVKRPLVDLIPRDPLVIDPETTLREVIEKLVETGRNCALVVSENTIVGIVTERDILLRVAHCYAQVADRPVRSVMTSDPERLRPSDTVAYGLNRMVVGDFRHVPIEDDGKALGVVSVKHVLGYMVDHHPELFRKSN